jgi:hypothetical protein
MDRRRSLTLRMLAPLVAVLMVAACGGSSPATPESGVQGSGVPVAGSGAPGSAAAGSPAASLAIAPLVDGISDPSSLVPPILEQGDVPPAEPATPAVKGSLTLATSAALASQTVGSGGGTIKVAKAGDPLDGLTIAVPAGTYTADVRFTVSERSISGSTFGSGVTPMSPLISIDNGGVVAGGDPVLVTIPATVPAGATVVGLYYHGDGGMLDPLPVTSSDAGSVTLAAAHFSDIFLALLDKAAIPATVESGFRPGVDDWEFTNYGSYVAPGGHCEGQVDSEIWYYVNQRLGGGASPLHGLYDNNGAPEKTPTLWQDDSDGYRLASVVQAGPHTNPAVWESYSNLDNSGTLTYDLLRLAIGLTGEPQELAIWDAAEGHGHAIAVYRVTPTRVYVADPNYPGRLRTIAYDAATGVLGPYSSGDSAGSIATGGAVSYTHFAFIPAEAAKSAATIAAAWAEFETSTIGDSTFPAYSLEVWTGQDEEGNDVWKPLEKEYTTSDAKLRVRLVVPAGGQGDLLIYRGASKLSDWGNDLTVDLKDGVNDLGFYEMGVVNGAWTYVDFLRIPVTMGPMDINGSWSGSLTFTEINMDAAAEKKASDEGCDLAVLEALRGKEMPMTLDLTANKEGKGKGTFVIDASSLNTGSDNGSSTTSEPTTLPLVYEQGLITFDFGDQCSGGTCTMTGTPAVVNGEDTIKGAMSFAGSGYSARAEWTVTREP